MGRGDGLLWSTATTRGGRRWPLLVLGAFFWAAWSPTLSAGELEVLFKAPWGSGPGQVGMLPADESSPEGPMAFAVDAAGDIWVLDQVNRRVVVLTPEGKVVEEITLARETYHDLVLGASGEMILLDRYGTPGVEVVQGGEVMARAPVVGEGIDFAGGVTALFLDADGVYAEYAHLSLLQVMDAHYQEVETRRRLGGRPSVDGKWLWTAQLAGRKGVQLWSTDRGRDVLQEERIIAFDRWVWQIVALEPMPQGQVLLVVHQIEEEPETFTVVWERYLGLVLDRDLVELWRFETQPSAGALEQFRAFTVDAHGAIYQSRFDAQGMEIRRWTR